MAVTDRRPSPTASPDNAAADSTRAQRLKIDKSGLYDLMQVKRLLDDEVIAFLEDEGYEEATTASNIKIGCGTVAVAAALYSHFNRRTFPENRTLIIACVLLYGVCAAIMNGTVLLMEGASFYAGVVPARARKTSKRDFAPCVWARSTLGQKGSSEYALQLCARARGAAVADMRKGYERYFTTEGRFLQPRFRADLARALGDFNAKKAK